MKKNIGRLDATIRVVLGIVALALGLFYRSWLGLLGLVPLLTASVHTCPLYLPFGISTRGAEGGGRKGA